LAAQKNGAGARERLIELFTPRIEGVAFCYRTVPSVSRCELMQAGVLGLLRALLRYDAKLGAPFWAYASWWVRESMQRLVSELTRPVVLSDRAHRQLTRLSEARNVLMQRNRRQPTTPELAAESGLTIKQLQALTLADRVPRGLEEPLGKMSDASTRTVGEYVRDPCAEDPYEEASVRAATSAVPRLLSLLTERERAVIEARQGLKGPERSLQELGNTMGLSSERVRQIEQSALEKMRAAA
jgi:RNA polymerase sigma factor (sigma-70 family)